MKLHTFLLMAFTMPLFAQYVAPDDDQLESLATDGAALELALMDATGEEAAALISRIISFVDGNDDFDAGRKDEIISDITITAVASLLTADQKQSFSRALVNSIPATTPTQNPSVTRKRLVLASLSLGGGDAPEVMEVLVESAEDVDADEQDANNDSISNPLNTLDEVLEYVPAPPVGNIPPLVPNPQPEDPGEPDPIPPLIPQQTQGGQPTTPAPPPPPPVPEPYDGQG